MRLISSRLEHMLRLSFPIALMAVLSVALTSISALANGGQGSLASQISRAQATITARPGTSPGTTITVGSMPWGVAILHGPAHLAYVSNNNSGSVSVISTLLRRVVATVPVGPGPNAVVAAPNGRAVYVGLDTNIAVIDTLTQRVTRYIDDPDGAFELDISPDGQRLYADSGGGPMLSVFDTRSGRLIESMNLEPIALGHSRFRGMDAPSTPASSASRLRSMSSTRARFGSPRASPSHSIPWASRFLPGAGSFT
jgi:YVTN family beta-propeller protein